MISVFVVLSEFLLFINKMLKEKFLIVGNSYFLLLKVGCSGKNKPLLQVLLQIQPVF